jgi:5,10-methylenetetrahydromethanopterin reductase
VVISLLKFGIQIRPNRPPKEFMSHAKLVEEQGFDFAWIADVGLHRETFIMCTLASQVTTRMKIGPGVSNPYVRHPAILAAEAATLQEISHGRSFLGLGLGGYRALSQLGIPTWNRPAKTLREAVTICRKLLDREVVNFHGTVFETTDAQIDFEPGEHIPIYLGVMLGKHGLKLAGELCDGALTVGPLGRTRSKFVVDQIKKAATEMHRSPENLEIAMATPFAVSEDRAEAFKMVKQAVAELAILDPRLRPALLAEGITDEEILRVQSAVKQGSPIHDVVSDNMVQLFGVAGTPSECVEKIKSLKETGITQLAVGRPARESPEMIKMIGRDIIPRVR